jgi:glycosyltransferase involved in cell wall biosynthesis
MNHTGMQLEKKQHKKFALINALSGGGAERQLIQLVQRDVFDKTFLFFNDFDYQVDKSKFELLYEKKPSLLQKVFLLIDAPLKLRKRGVDKYTELFCFLQLSCYIGFICKLLFGSKFIYCLRTNPFDYYKFNKDKKLPFFLYKFILLRADKIICNSAATAQQVKQKFPQCHVQFISNGYNIDEIQKKANESVGQMQALFDNNIVFITSGRLDIDKGQWHLIKIFKGVQQKLPNCKLMLLGQGPLENKLKELCHLLQLQVSSSNAYNSEADVFFCGFVQNPYALYRRAKLFLLTSSFEGLPNTPIEALLCGTPVMLADCRTGPREILLPTANTTEVASRPIYCEGGILMPPFAPDNSFDVNMSAQQQNWVQEICNNFPAAIVFKAPDASMLSHRFDINIVSKLW